MRPWLEWRLAGAIGMHCDTLRPGHYSYNHHLTAPTVHITFNGHYLCHSFLCLALNSNSRCRHELLTLDYVAVCIVANAALLRIWPVFAWACVADWQKLEYWKRQSCRANMTQGRLVEWETLFTSHSDRWWRICLSRFSLCFSSTVFVFHCNSPGKWLQLSWNIQDASAAVMNHGIKFTSTRHQHLFFTCIVIYHWILIY